MLLGIVFTVAPFVFLFLGFYFLVKTLREHWSRPLNITLTVAFLILGVLVGIWRLHQPEFGPFTDNLL